MSSIISSIGSALGSVFKTIGGGNLGQGLTRGAGIGLAVPSLISQMQQAGQENNYLKTMLDINQQTAAAQQNLFNTTPQQAASQITSLTAPLNEQLVSSVSNPVQAYLAERGLSQAPGIQAQTLAQALAPYELQNQQTATQAWEGLRQIPFYASYPGVQFPQPAGFQGLASLLMNQPKAPQSPLLPNPFYGQGSFGTPTPGSLQPQSSPNPGLASPYYMDPGVAQPPWMAQVAQG